MGHSIALNAAWSGLDVKMHGVSDEDLAQGWKNMLFKLDVLVKHEMMDHSAVENIKSKIKTTTSIETAVADASFVIEAIPEDIELKRNMFKKLDTLCDINIVLASNTSGFSPTKIASAVMNLERVVVTHFWNPAHLIPLVEVVPGEGTDQDTIERTMQLMSNMNKKPIKVNKDVPGFVGNRLQYALFREAQYLLEEGVASKRDIDAAVKYSFGRRLPVTGPLMTADMGGLDVFADISNYLFSDLSKADSSLFTITQLVEQNKLGDKNGEGFYEWSTISSKQMNQARDEELIRFLKQDMEID